MTHFKLVYGKPCHLPVELEHKAFWAIKVINFDMIQAGKKRVLDLHELEEIRLSAYENAKIYKEKPKKWHDNHIIRREFKIGDFFYCSIHVLSFLQENSSPNGAARSK
jgi:hypothetical protein